MKTKYLNKRSISFLVGALALICHFSVLAQAGRQANAVFIRDSSAITLATSHSSGIVDADSTAKANIVDTALCTTAETSNYADPGETEVWLHTGLLNSMKILVTTYGYTYRVTEIAGGDHSANSYHYRGTAFDVSIINGSGVSSSNPYWSTFNQRCRNMGSIESLGPGDAGHSTHVHNAWSSGTSASSAGGCSIAAPSLFYDAGAGAMNIYRWASSKTSFSTITQTGIGSGYTLSNVGNHMASADVNADYRTDNVVAYQYGDGTMRLHVFLNGSSYQGGGGWFQSGIFSLANVGGRMVGGDFNGDGKGDVAMVYDNGAGLAIYRFLSTGSAFNYDSVTVATSGYDLAQVGENIAAADVNGDARTDIVLAYQYGDGTMRLHVFLNGNSYQGPGGWYQSGAFPLANVAGRMAGGDFDGNGKGDVAMLYDNGGGMTVYRFLSSGSSFSASTTVVATSGYDLAQVGTRFGAGDINGDGKADTVVAYQYGDNTFRYHTFLNGNTYQGGGGWYQSGAFNLANVGGRMTMGTWQ